LGRKGEPQLPIGGPVTKVVQVACSKDGEVFGIGQTRDKDKDSNDHDHGDDYDNSNSNQNKHNKGTRGQPNA